MSTGSPSAMGSDRTAITPGEYLELEKQAQEQAKKEDVRGEFRRFDNLHMVSVILSAHVGGDQHLGIVYFDTKTHCVTIYTEIPEKFSTLTKHVIACFLNSTPPPFGVRTIPLGLEYLSRPG